jgi:flagellin
MKTLTETGHNFPERINFMPISLPGTGNSTISPTHRSLTQAQNKLSEALAKLSSGQSINSAADDAAGLAISENLRAQLRSLNQAQRNAFDGISVVQIADSALGGSNDALMRMRELAMQASNGALSDSERANIQTEFSQLSASIDNTATNTEFNGQKLLDGSLSTSGLSFQVGIQNTPADSIEIKVGSATSDSLGIGDLSVSAASDAQNALAGIDAAMQKINETRSDLGTSANRLQSAVSNLSIAAENYAAADMRIRDTDVAAEVTKKTANQILLNASASLLAQANNTNTAMLPLLNKE